MSSDDNNSSTSGTSGPGSSNDYPLLKEYLLANSPEYKELDSLRQQGWDNSDGDRFFKRQRDHADHASQATQIKFFLMMKGLAKELDDATSALTLALNSTTTNPLPSPRILDLCMAPGGFSAAALNTNPRASVRGISLPLSNGGHRLRLPNWETDPRVTVLFCDITMLAGEMGVGEIPPGWPDAGEFSFVRPFVGEEFGLVFCDGQVLRTHQRAAYREMREGTRLSASQLVVALSRVKKGGTIVMLLHKADRWDSVVLLHTFSKFASIELFKPRQKHAMRSSFYLVAKEVQPQSPDALQAIEGWKERWRLATFGEDSEYEQSCKPSQCDMESLLAEFGPRLIGLGAPIWNIQAAALRRAPFIQTQLRHGS